MNNKNKVLLKEIIDLMKESESSSSISTWTPKKKKTHFTDKDEPKKINESGGPMFPDIKVKLVGKDGNVFNLIGLTSNALKKAGHQEEAKEFTQKCFSAGSYNEVLRIIMSYVDVQ